MSNHDRNNNNLNIEDAMNIVFNDEELTDTCFSFVSDYLDDEIEPFFTVDEMYENIKICYLAIAEFHISSTLSSFKFIDYTDCRTVSINGSVFDLEELIADDEDEIRAICKENLYEIDALCSDLNDDIDRILKKVEILINNEINSQ